MQSFKNMELGNMENMEISFKNNGTEHPNNYILSTAQPMHKQPI